ncbi:hypothetical protein [Nonomuraea glycinis]
MPLIIAYAADRKCRALGDAGRVAARILVVQAVPALLALILVVLAR